MKSAPSPAIVGMMDAVTLRGASRMTLKLKNLDAQEKHLRIRLILSQEISADTSTAEMKLTPYQETQIQFSIHNFSALNGSTYPAHAVIEYDLAGMHHTAIASGMVRIAAANAVMDRWPVPAAVAACGLLFLWLNVRARQKQK